MGMIYEYSNTLNTMVIVGEVTNSDVRGDYPSYGGTVRSYIYHVSDSLKVKEGILHEGFTIGEMDKSGNVYEGSKSSNNKIGEVDNIGNVYKVSGVRVGKVSFKNLKELAGGAVFLLVYREKKRKEMESEMESAICPVCGTMRFMTSPGNFEPCAVCWFNRHRSFR